MRDIPALIELRLFTRSAFFLNFLSEMIFGGKYWTLLHRLFEETEVCLCFPRLRKAVFHLKGTLLWRVVGEGVNCLNYSCIIRLHEIDLVGFIISATYTLRIYKSKPLKLIYVQYISSINGYKIPQMVLYVYICIYISIYIRV